jgi:LacI family transcriptional regulator
MTSLVKAIQGRSRSHDVGVFLADTDDSPSIERRVCEELARQTRGLLLCAPRMSDEHIREISELVPIVLVNRIVSDIPSIYTDSTQAYGELVDQLADFGHRTIAYLPGPSGSWADKARRQVIAARAEIDGLSLVVLPPTTAQIGDGIAAAESVISAGATAVLAFDDVLAAGLIEGFRRSGLSVPDDVSVAGHDDVLANLVQPRLTTIAGHSSQVGEIALDRLLAESELGGAASDQHVGVTAELVTRASTSHPPTR